MTEVEREKAIALLKAGLGRAHADLLWGSMTPIYCYWLADNGTGISNGTISFLDCGSGCFGVTAGHVVETFRQFRQNRKFISCQIGHDFPFDFENRLIDIDTNIDLATFRVSSTELTRLGKHAFGGTQSNWPPRPPTVGRGVIFAGFPGRERIQLNSRAISFGLVNIGGIATSVSERDISFQIEREHMVDTVGLGELPMDYNWGGMSGGLLLTLVEQAGFFSFRLGGIVCNGPNSESGEMSIGLEIIQARRADFLKPDGKINRSLWL